MENVQITSQGIQNTLSNIKPYSAICEYIWNGFDAGATKIDIEFNTNQFGSIDSLTISDNGSGIDYTEISQKFKPFHASEKFENKQKNFHHSLPHGKNGIGRLTFFSFASDAEWNTIYKENDEITKEYYIRMSSQLLNQYDLNNKLPPITVSEKTGTKVSFNNVVGIIEDILIQEIKNEFFWLICLYAQNNYEININKNQLDFNDKIKEKFSINISDLLTTNKFDINVILWNESLGKEYSKYYFINSKGVEVYKDNTTLNKKSDNFWHSVIIKSDYFNNFNFDKVDDDQLAFTKNKNDAEYKNLIQYINEHLIKKRHEYLKVASTTYINKLIDDGLYPSFDKANILNSYRKKQLDNIVESLYQAEPIIFTSLNNPQKKIFIRLLNTIMNSDDKESLFKVINEVIELDESERKDFAVLLEKTTLENIISTIKLIEDRISVVQALKEIVFNKEFNSYEVKHVQAIVENHYWLFGEQYHLLTSAEPDFNEALRRLLFANEGNAEKVSIDHEDVNKEMDIFMNKQNKASGYFENIVVELKRPSISIGESELSQVKKYMRVIQSEDRFNSKSKWVYYLVGNHFNKNGYIQGEIETNQSHGESGLVYHAKNQKIYVKTWAEIFEEFSIKSDYLLKELNFEKDVWLKKHLTADETVDDVKFNSAHLKELQVPAI